jgi:hypothetical protein
MSLTTTTVTHTFTNPDGSPCVGEVEFTLTKGITNGSSTIVPVSISADLDDSGDLSQNLISNLDTSTNPIDSYTRVDIRLAGLQTQTYFIQVPVGTTGTPYPTVDLGTLLPSDGATVPVDVVPIWQTYLDVNRDVKPWLQIVQGQRAYDDALRDITAMACEWVQTYLGRPVAPTQIFRRFNGWTGWQGSYIQVPYYPVIGTPTVVEYWGASGPHILTEQTPQQQSNTSGGDFGDVFQIDHLKGRITRTFPGLIQRPFFPGERNIEVTWVAGYNPVPQQIRAATLELCNYWYRQTQEAVRTAGPTGPMEYDEPGPGNLWPAVPNRVTALLEPFTQVGIA